MWIFENKSIIRLLNKLSMKLSNMKKLKYYTQGHQNNSVKPDVFVIGRHLNIHLETTLSYELKLKYFTGIGSGSVQNMNGKLSPPLPTSINPDCETRIQKGKGWSLSRMLFMVTATIDSILKASKNNC